MGHSKKTLKTITEIDTTPEMWGITPFTVRAERRDLFLPADCDACYGKGHDYLHYRPIEQKYLSTCDVLNTNEVFEALGWEEPEISDSDLGGWHDRNEAEAIEAKKWNILHNERRSEVAESFVGLSGWPCAKCANGREQYNRRTGRTAARSTGYVWRMHYDVKVNAHYPAWPVGTTFPSRFDGCDCEACAKTIRKSSTYPVVAQRADGTHVGMYVGNACVTKFGFKKFKATDAQAKSWGKANRSKRGELIIDIYVRSKTITADDLEGTDLYDENGDHICD